ncbi:MAG: tetratricopeptide repeat protein, partial [Methyloprofundus sp.]
MKKQVSIPGLAEQAQALHKSGKYKEAIKLYEKLLQTPDADLCREPLANCYVQRAIGFAAKDMYKEALALWENHTQFTQPPYEAYDQYITWVVLSNNPVNIQTS